MAIPDPSEVAPWYLRNITQALELNEATGTPDILTLCVAYQSNNADLLWKFGWEELTN
jgi:hypothetical protein